jgi:intracellular sulfur oxidation DsrE/DsrF family protein
VSNIPNVTVNLQDKATTINEAVDHIQEIEESAVPLIIHTGAMNVIKESSRTSQQRLQRLETNIIAKNISAVALSSVIYNGNDSNRKKIKTINSELLKICKRNNWLYIDNDNLDETCLIRSSWILNREGLRRIENNFKNCISNFTMPMSKSAI